MANSISKFKKYVPLLDEIYKETAKTSILDMDGADVQMGANANEIIIPKMDMAGLGNYDRNSGYVSGDVTLTNQTVAFNYERGRMFSIDAMDDEETAGIAYGRLAGEFIRTKVVPEVDAFRFSAYAQLTGIGKATGTLSDGGAVVTALRNATNAMDEAEVPMEDRILFITPTLKGMIEDLDNAKSREVLSRFTAVIAVPQSRFYTNVTLLATANGGYVKAETGKDINFMIVHKPAVIQITKHVAPKVITPEQNQSADAWMFGYRNYGLADAYENKVAGIFCHSKA